MKTSRHDPLADRLRGDRNINTVCRALAIPDTWDVVIICDGSATTWGKEAGWGWTLIQRRPTLRRIDGNGSGSCGSNMFAELMGFLHPLTLLAQEKIKGTLNVFVITDCEQMKNWGSGSKGRGSKYEELWFLLGAYERRGLKVEYRWAPRDTINLNKFAHDMANVGRRWQKSDPDDPIKMARIERRKILRKLNAKTIYHLNPLE